MKISGLSVYVMIIVLGFCAPSIAQVLDDDTPVAVQQENNPSSFSDTDKSEALFNEMFGDHPEITQDSEAVSGFGDVVQKAAESVKKSGAAETQNLPVTQTLPVNGDLLIGVTKGSFKIFQDITGRTNCSFGVTLKSEIDRDLHTMGLRLIYQQRAFAFIFRNVQAKGAQERFITTNGDICYNMAGVPDIEINICKISRAMSNECAKRIKWDSNLESPDSSKNPY